MSEEALSEVRRLRALVERLCVDLATIEGVLDYGTQKPPDDWEGLCRALFIEVRECNAKLPRLTQPTQHWAAYMNDWYLRRKMVEWPEGVIIQEPADV